jgi:hypothetical protein
MRKFTLLIISKLYSSFSLESFSTTISPKINVYNR